MLCENMFRMGVNNAVKFENPVEEFLDFIKTDFSAAELVCDSPGNLPSDFDSERIKIIRDLSESRDIRISLHAIYLDINPVSVVPQVREFAVDELKKSIELASDLGAGVVTMHAGYCFHWWRIDPAKKRIFDEHAADVFCMLGDFAQDCGVVIGIENGSWFLGTPKKNQLGDGLTPMHFCIDAREHFDFIKKIDHSCVGVTFDITKSFCSGNDVIKHFKLLSKNIVNVHLADLSAMEFDKKALFAYLAKNYSGNIISEICNYDIALSNKLQVESFIATGADFT